MPKAGKLNIENRRSVLATSAAAVPAVVTGAPMAAAALADRPAQAKPQINYQDGIDWLKNAMISVPLCHLAENDEHILYSVRVPRAAFLGSDPYPVPGLADERFCADVAAYLAARIRELTAEPAPLA